MRAMKHRLSWIAVVAVLLAFPAVAWATVYFSGYVGPGGERSTGCCKTRNGDAQWLTGYSGFVGVTRSGGAAWVALDKNTTGSGHVSTYTDVETICGNSSSVTYFMSCATNNV